MKQESIQAMRDFTAKAREAFDRFADGVEDAEYVKAAEIILASRQKGGRLHITGIGKPGHVSGYGAPPAPPPISCTAPRRCTAPAGSSCRATW